MKQYLTAFFALIILASACTAQQTNKQTAKQDSKQRFSKEKTEAEWKKILTPKQFEIMVKRGTETPFQNPYFDNHEKGYYVSAATGDTLFSSETKFESGTGWPSFYAPVANNKVTVVKDDSYGMSRDEVIETSTGLHLGHVFNDGPQPTGLRYCMNSAAFKFIKSK